MTRAEQQVLAVSRARDLCLSLRRAFAGKGALERLRAGEAARLRPDELEMALGLAWAAGELESMRAAFASLPAGQVDRDAALSALRAASAAGDRG